MPRQINFMRIFNCTILLILTLCVFHFPNYRLCAEQDIITTVQESMPAIVTIAAENTKLYQSPPTATARDPRTGRIVVRKGLTTAAYNRIGAGVILDTSGIIVTNAHTISKANRIKVILHDQTKIPAQPIKVISNYDLAYLQITPPYPLLPIVFADSDKVQLKDEVITVGNSEVLKQTISGGFIIGIGTSATEKEQGLDTTGLLQTSINLYKGDSGGPLLDKKGHLIGLMVAGQIKKDHSSFAIPSNKIKQYYAQIH